MVGPLSGAKSYGYRRLVCGAYGCFRCSRRKLRRVRMRIAEEAQERKLTRFATLTLDPKRIPEDISSLRYLRECWRKMRVYLARYAGHSIEFISVVELQKSGVAHLHVLVGTYLPQRWLSDAWQGVGGGRIVQIKWVDARNVAAYLSKYLTKEKQGALPAGLRRFSCSKGIVLWVKKKPSSGWWLSSCSIDELREFAQQVTGERWERYEPEVEWLVWFEGDLSSEAIYSGIVRRRRRGTSEGSRYAG